MMRHRVAELRKTCAACPAQWEGMTEDGMAIYIRYRWGFLSVSVGIETIFCQRAGDSLDGYMEDDQLREHLRGVLEFS